MRGYGNTVENKVMHSRAICLLLSLMVSLGMGSAVGREWPKPEITASEEDFALRDATVVGDIALFRSLIDGGADPFAWLDDSQTGWTYCVSTAPGREAFLGYLIARGFDVNYRQRDISASLSLPLTCAIGFSNVKALELLIDAGADPTLPSSEKFPDSVPMSVLSEAVINSEFELAVWLFDKANYSDVQLLSDVRMLERFPYDESAPGNVHRLRLAELLRQRGFEVNPWTKDRAADPE